MKVEFSRQSVLAVIGFAGIVLIYLGFEHSDNIALLVFGVAAGLFLILLVAYLWHWYQEKRAKWYPFQPSENILRLAIEKANKAVLMKPTV